MIFFAAAFASACTRDSRNGLVRWRVSLVHFENDRPEPRFGLQTAAAAAAAAVQPRTLLPANGIAN